MASVEYVVESYADYLRGRGRKFWRRFQTTRNDAPESALAEAMVFRVLQACKVDPTVADAPGFGGPDFQCLQGKPNAFMAEATSLLPERVTEKSNLIASPRIWKADPSVCSLPRSTRRPRKSCISLRE